MLRLNSKLRTAVRLLRTRPGRLASILRGDFFIYFVHSAELADVPPPEGRDGLLFRPVTGPELRELARRFPELHYQVEHLEIVGRISAYAVVDSGRTAHICWMITEDLERRLPQRLVGLGPGEIEIAKAYTFPEFRGRALYPFAIRSLCALARQQGFTRVFMITMWANRSSRRGIEKAGLRRHGWIILMLPPVIGTMLPLLSRVFRFLPQPRP